MSVSELPPERVAIGKWSIDQYVRVVRWWAVAWGLMAAWMVIMSKPQAWIFGLEAAAFLSLGYSVQRRGGGRVEALVAGSMSGLLIGFLVSSSRFLLQLKTIWAINIVSETLLTALLGAVLTVSGTLIASLIKTQR